MKLSTFMAGLLALVQPLHAAEDYELRMARPVKVGDRFQHTGKLQEETSSLLKIDRLPVKADETKIDVQYTTEVEIQAVNPKGKPIGFRLKVAKIEGTMNGKPLTQLSAGDEVEVRYKASTPAEKEFLVNQKPADKEQMKLISSLCPLGSIAGPTDDDVFGPKKRVQPGDEWNVDGEQAAQQAAETGLTGLKADGVTGKTKLTGVVETEGKSCLRIHGEFEVKGSGMPLPKVPPGVKVSAMSIKVMADGDFPIDTADPAIPAETMMMTMQMTAGGLIKVNGDEKEIDVATKGKSARKESVKAIK